MLSVTKKLYLPLLLSAVLYGFGIPITAHAQTSGYVPLTFNPNPGVTGGNDSVTGSSSLESCMQSNALSGHSGSIAIYVSTSQSGGTYLGTDSGTGVIFNSIDEGNYYNQATYYFYGYYTTSGSGDLCDSIASPSSTKTWYSLTVSQAKL